VIVSDADRKRTTKYVSGTFKLTFHGDYVDAEDVERYFHDWVDAGLDDRDDLRGWTFEVHAVQEVHGDPEGFDQ
jgi:hypothetical protein